MPIVHEAIRGHHVEAQPYQRVAVLTDPHFPYADWPLIHSALAFLEDWGPDLILLLGDQVDFYSISSYSQDPKRKDTVQSDIDSVIPFLEMIDDFKSDVIVFQGNHEERMDRLIKTHSGLSDLRSLSFPNLFKIPERWRWAGSQVHYQIGDLLFLHGDLAGRGYASKNPATSMVAKLRSNCLFGHVHRFDSHIGTMYDGSPMNGYSIGHMSRDDAQDFCRSPDWQQGFATVEFDYLNRLYHVNQHIARNGCFRFGGKTYGTR